jgi:hypothetical protein
MILKIARQRGHLLSRAAIVADHVHLALGCGIAVSPMEVALCYMNNLAYAMGMRPVFMFSYYVGTFGEYDRGVVGKGEGAGVVGNHASTGAGPVVSGEQHGEVMQVAGNHGSTGTGPVGARSDKWLAL